MADTTQTAGRFSRRGTILTLIGAVLLFFTIYFVVLGSINSQSGKELESRLRNVQSSLEAIRERTADTAWWLSSNRDVRDALEKGDPGALKQICGSTLARTRVSLIAITDSNGTFLASVESRDEAETNSTVISTCLTGALRGAASSGIEEDQAQGLVIQAASPLKNDKGITGTVFVRQNAFSEHTFADDVVKNFGLVCSVFHGDVRISTTIFKEGKRVVGTKLTNNSILIEVLQNGGTWKGRNKVLGKEYDTVYLPLRDTRGKIVGVVGLGKDRESLTSIFTTIALVAIFIAAFTGVIMSRKSFRIQSLMLLVVVPALLAITVASGIILYTNLYEIILDGFNRKLFALSTSTAASMNGDELSGFLNRKDPQEPAFVRYQTPLRQILKDKNVTYLYNFTLGGKKDIRYIIDASPGDDFCPIGYEEEVPMQNVEGLRRVVSEGKPYTSGIQEYERYGLLKVSAAPVYGSNNTVKALSGVDINISVITSKTRLALLEIFGVGALALLLAGLVSLWVSQKLIEPLNRVKSGALRIAAGQHDHAIDVADPKEMHDLALAFNRLGTAIKDLLLKAGESNEQAESGSQTAELARNLGHIDEAGLPPLSVVWLCGHPDCADASGAINIDGRILAWISDQSGETLDMVKSRRDTATVSARLLQHCGSNWPELAGHLKLLLGNTIRAFVLVDSAGGTVRAVTRGPIDAILVDQRGRLTPVKILEGREPALPQGTSLVLTSRIDSASISTLAARGTLTIHENGTIAGALEEAFAGAGRDAPAPVSGLLVVIERSAAG